MAVTTWNMEATIEKNMTSPRFHGRNGGMKMRDRKEQNDISQQNRAISRAQSDVTILIYEG